MIRPALCKDSPAAIPKYSPTTDWGFALLEKYSSDESQWLNCYHRIFVCSFRALLNVPDRNYYGVPSGFPNSDESIIGRTIM